ncbi:MAG: flavoprotein, partial [Klebsiella variicola]
MKLIIGMTGATGAPLGVALLQALRDMPEVETHLVMSKWAKTTIELETPWTAREVAALADFSHSRACMPFIPMRSICRPGCGRLLTSCARRAVKRPFRAP